MTGSLSHQLDQLSIESDVQQLTCIDLFAGAGGFSKSAQDIGIQVRLAVEIDRHACTTFRENIIRNSAHPVALYDEDIENLNPKNLFKKHFSDGKSCDLLLGGPPCQGFSTHRFKDAGVDDPRNKLIHQYFEFVKAFRPKAFLLENVPGMLWPRHQNYVENFYRVVKCSKYNVMAPVVIDARDYGLPQRRKRVFILGFAKELDHSDLQWPPRCTHGNQLAVENDPNLKVWNDCHDVFKVAMENDPNNVHMIHSQELVRAFKKTPPNGGSRKDSGRVLECHKNHKGHKDVYGRIDSYQPAPTMTASCINPSKGRFVHPTHNHGITARQAARIQTFPDDFIFHGGLMAAGQQIGNAVPIELAKILLGHISEFLQK